MATNDFYADRDLVFIHDAGFHSYALDSTPAILRLIQSANPERGLVIDLGSGTGRFAGEAVRVGYACLGIDQSRAMNTFARKAVPAARFRTESMFSAKLPTCTAVVSIGECLNYRDAGSNRRSLKTLFRAIYAALRPGGVFIFDIATPARAPKSQPRIHRTDAEDWNVISVTTRRTYGLRRRVVYFKRHGEHYRRGEEVHDQNLYPAAAILAALRTVGFKARRLPASDFPRVQGMAWFHAVKP
jgi:SAM-dependent methyltransferase